MQTSCKLHFTVSWFYNIITFTAPSCQRRNFISFICSRSKCTLANAAIDDTWHGPFIKLTSLHVYACVRACVQAIAYTIQLRLFLQIWHHGLCWRRWTLSLVLAERLSDPLPVVGTYVRRHLVQESACFTTASAWKTKFAVSFCMVMCLPCGLAGSGCKSSQLCPLMLLLYRRRNSSIIAHWHWR
jgi:hypothetical protein